MSVHPVLQGGDYSVDGPKVTEKERSVLVSIFERPPLPPPPRGTGTEHGHVLCAMPVYLPTRTSVCAYGERRRVISITKHVHCQLRKIPNLRRTLGSVRRPPMTGTTIAYTYYNPRHFRPNGSIRFENELKIQPVPNAKAVGLSVNASDDREIERRFATTIGPSLMW